MRVILTYRYQNVSLQIEGERFAFCGYPARPGHVAAAAGMVEHQFAIRKLALPSYEIVYEGPWDDPVA